MGNVESLPKWAQAHIAHLEIQAANAETRLRRHEEGIGVDDNGTLRVRHNQRVALIGADTWTDGVEAKFLEDGTLEVTATGLAIKPRVSNVVQIKGGPR